MTQATQLVPLIIILPLLTFWFWMFRDLIRNDTLTGDERLRWTFALTFLNVFGAGLYYLTEYKKRH